MTVLRDCSGWESGAAVSEGGNAIGQFDLGARIKRLRGANHLTLKAVEERSGISATHVSDIERGKTSPTVGALMRIARALGTDPGYLLEEEELDTVSVTTVESRKPVAIPGSGCEFERLSDSIPGSSLSALRFTLDPAAAPSSIPHVCGGTVSAVVLTGSVRIAVGRDRHVLGEGDAIHFDASLSHSFENPSPDTPASLAWFCAERSLE